MDTGDTYSKVDKLEAGEIEFGVKSQIRHGYFGDKTKLGKKKGAWPWMEE
jgi:hypothetical protein